MGKFCANCGKPCNEGAKFCSGCGAPLNSYNQPQPLNNKASYQGQDKVNSYMRDNSEVNQMDEQKTADTSSKENIESKTGTEVEKQAFTENNMNQEVDTPNNMNRAQYSQQYGNQVQYQNNQQYYGGQQYSGCNSQQNSGRQYNNQQCYNQGYGNGQYQYNMNNGYGIRNQSAFSNIMMNILNIIIKPAKGIQEFIDNRTKEETYAILGVFSGIQCLLFIWLMRRLMFTTFTLSGFLSGDFGDILGSSGDYVKEIISKAISSMTGTFFIAGLFITAVLVFGYILSLHILNKNADILIKVKIVTVAAIQIVCGMFVIILLSYLFVPLSYCITGFVNIAVIVYFIGNIQKYITNGEYNGYGIALIYMIISVIAAIILIIMFSVGAFSSVMSIANSIF